MSAVEERHEPTDAEPRLVGIIAASVAFGIAAALLAALGIIALGSHRGGAASLGKAGLFTHGPEERTSLEEEWPKLTAETRRHLETYAWIDRPAGIVRVPIEQAMERLAATSPGASRAEPAPRP